MGAIVYGVGRLLRPDLPAITAFVGAYLIGALVALVFWAWLRRTKRSNSPTVTRRRPTLPRRYCVSLGPLASLGVFRASFRRLPSRNSEPRQRVTKATASPYARAWSPCSAARHPADWRDGWQRARAALCHEAYPSCKDPSGAYWLPSHPGSLLDTSTLPALPKEPRRTAPRGKAHQVTERPSPRRGLHAQGHRQPDYRRTRRAECCSQPCRLEARQMDQRGGAGTSRGRDALYTQPSTNGLLGDDGQRQVWATIRSPRGAGLQQPVDLEADKHEKP